MTDISGRDWWRGAVIYQIYPRSFMDASGDGVGDLAGITAKLGYIASLGVDAIWLSPFFKSPMRDFGYDISDYRDVDPLFGTLEDFDQLVERAHELGLKVMIDQVLSHSSEQHPWFQQSRSDRNNPKADWYVWADPKPDGTPPNNWLAVFGGVAWHWEARRRQYYLHNFLISQPDLNLHNPAVQEQLLADVEFWLQRGVDGFRLDVVNFYFHDHELRDNPAKVPDNTAGVRPGNPYAYQRHIYDKTRPENLVFLQRLRELLERYPGTTTVGEIGAEDDLATMAAYTSGGDKLHMAYSFKLLTAQFDSAHIRSIIEVLESGLGDGWPCWSMSNHDVARAVSRWGGAEPSPELAKVLLALLGSLRGSICLYQGEELGLPEAELDFEHLQDPYGIAFWPDFKGRDGCRTPMPWTRHGAAAGFSPSIDNEPWLPIPEQHRLLAVEVQDHVPGSVLNFCRHFLHWRRDQPALRLGSIEFLDAPTGLLAFTRSYSGQTLVACFNLAGKPASFKLEVARPVIPLTGHGFAAQLQGATVELPAFGAFFGRLEE